MSQAAASAHSSESQELPDLLSYPEDERDSVWLRHYYRGGGTPQLTVRAVVMGMLLGGVMSLSNLYVGLKTGWGLGVAITSCILSYAIWQVVLKLGLSKSPMSVLENNCMQSTASSAGYSTGGTMVSAIAAYLMLTGTQIPFWVLFWWTAFLALLGVSMAIPMKRQMINREQLKFPSGIAAAETLRSLHASGAEAMARAKALFATLGAGALLQWMLDGQPGLIARLGLTGPAAKLALPHEIELPFRIRGKDASTLGIAFPIDFLLTAAGMIVGMKTSLSMAAAGLILFAFIGPWLDDSGVIREMHALGALPSDALGPGNIRKWGLWCGSAMMVTAGITSMAFQWKSMARAVTRFRDGLRKSERKTSDDPLAAIEVPNSWFLWGTVISSIGCIAIMKIEWNIGVHWGIVAIALSFVLSLVACRATGETDTTPIGPMGKVTQLFYGLVIPGQSIPNLMTAGVTAGAAGSSADLLTDLKSGYLLGANPRQQTIAQALGIIAGTVVVVPIWYVLVPDAAAVGNENFPAPAAEVWRSVAELLSRGLETMHPTVKSGMIWGGLLGILFAAADGLLPQNLRKWVPSATGAGLGMVIPFTNSLSFLLGSLIAFIWAKSNEKSFERFMVASASGIIAGGSIMGIVITLLSAAGVFPS